MRTTLVTASDKNFFVHLQGLIRSIVGKEEGKGIGICVFDLGLSPEQIKWLKELSILVLDIHECLKLSEEHDQNVILKGLIIRAFLPNLIDSEIIIWIDADTWVQDWKAIKMYEEAALKGSLGITPELHRNYRAHVKSYMTFVKLSYREYHRAFGKEIARKYSRYPILNAGVFSMLRDSPYWKIWQDIIIKTLSRSISYIDQITLNYAVYSNKISSVELLPAYCNWGCHQCLPAFDTNIKKFVEPSIPHDVIGIMHLTGVFKKYKQLKIMTTTGNSINIPIRYV